MNKSLVSLTLIITALFGGLYIYNSQINLLQQKVESDFQVDVAEELGAFTVVSYCKQKHIEKWNCGPVCKKYPNITSQDIIYNEEQNILAYTAYSPSLNSVVVTFKGTSTLSFKNWLYDLEILQVDYPGCQGCKVEQGFFKNYQGLSIGVMESLQKQLENYPEAGIYVTGHSLGAALATLFAGELIQKGVQNFQIYNFGSPRVGNDKFSEWFDSTYKNILYRVTHSRDPFIHMPMRWMGGYHHNAQEIFYEDSSEPNAPHKACNMSGEDPECSDQYSKLTEWRVLDHNEYMGYNYLETMERCAIL